MSKMSQIFTLHKDETCEKCPTCGENMYDFRAGILRCDCGAEIDPY